MAVVITNELLRSLKKSDKRYNLVDSLTTGLTVVVNQSSIRVFDIYKQAISGKKMRVLLGTMPGIDIDRARARCERRKQQSGVITKARATRPRVYNKEHEGASLGIQEHIENFKAHRVEKLSGHSQRLYNSMLVIVAVQFDHIDEIQPYRIRGVMDSMMDTPVLANRWKSTLSAMCSYLVETGCMQFNPCLSVRRFTETPSTVHLRREELTKLAIAMQDTQCSEDIQITIQLLLATGARSGEVNDMTWEEMEPGGKWTLPADRSKTGRSTMMFIPPSVMDRIESSRTHRTGRILSCSKGAVRQALARLLKKAGMAHASPHALRRTVATILAQEGIDPNTRSRFLNHSPVGVNERVYTVFDYADDKLKAASKLWKVLVDAKILSH